MMYVNILKPVTNPKRHHYSRVIDEIKWEKPLTLIVTLNMINEFLIKLFNFQLNYLYESIMMLKCHYNKCKKKLKNVK